MHKVLMSFTFRKGWHICFFDCDRRRSQLPRLGFCNSDEATMEFSRRAGGPKTLEDRTIFDMLIQRGAGEVTLELTDEQFPTLPLPLRSHLLSSNLTNYAPTGRTEGSLSPGSFNPLRETIGTAAEPVDTVLMPSSIRRVTLP
jgi:hypothetical protein